MKTTEKEKDEIYIPHSSINNKNINVDILNKKNIKPEISEEIKKNKLKENNPSKTDKKINDINDLKKSINLNKMDDAKKEIIENKMIQKEKESKDEQANIPKNKINNLDIQSLYSIMENRFNFQEKKFEETLAKMKEESDMKIIKINEEKEKELAQMKEENQKALSQMKKETDKKIFDLEKDIQYLKNIIGSIQIRKLAKNFLNIFRNQLNSTEEEIINQDNTKKGEITLKALKRNYKDYIDGENFQIIEEIVKGAGKTYNDGNKEAHTLNIKYYEKEIIEFKNKFSISTKSNDYDSLNKILFLKQIGTSDNNFVKCYNFILKYCSESMSSAILRGDIIDLFIKSNKK